MIGLLDIIGLDYLGLVFASLAAVGALHFWLRRRRHVRQFPALMWLMAGVVLLFGSLLVQVEAWDQVAAWRRIGTIGLVGLLETAMVVFSCLVALLKEEIAKRRRAQLRLRGYRQRLQQQVRARSEELVGTQRQAMQSEKLASLGQLAAGVAHEINTPIQYVGDNLRAISDFIRDLVGLTGQYQELVRVVKAGMPAGDLIRRIERAEADSELDYIREDAPKAVAEGLEGVQRVAYIVRAMKDFAHLDRGQVGLVDVNAALARTLTLTRNEYKYVADVETDFADVPEIEAYGAELNQVFLNIIVNAAHAIADTGKRGTITVRTRVVGQQVEVAIADTGGGIPVEIQGRIFDPFFTTKPVGKGTGQGLNIAHQIVNQHGGTIRFESQVGQGTTFHIRLPVKLAREEAGVKGRARFGGGDPASGGG